MYLYRSLLPISRTGLRVQSHASDMARYKSEQSPDANLDATDDGHCMAQLLAKNVGTSLSNKTTQRAESCTSQNNDEALRRDGRGVADQVVESVLHTRQEYVMTSRFQLFSLHANSHATCIVRLWRACTAYKFRYRVVDPIPPAVFRRYNSPCSACLCAGYSHSSSRACLKDACYKLSCLFTALPGPVKPPRVKSILQQLYQRMLGITGNEESVVVIRYQ